MGYSIEGIISEVTIGSNGKLESFKICGTEGYALQKKIDEKSVKYNVLCKKSKKDDDVLNAIIFKSDTKIKCNEDFLSKRFTSLPSGIRICITLKKCKKDNKKGDIEITGKHFTLKKLSLLSN